MGQIVFFPDLRRRTRHRIIMVVWAWKRRQYLLGGKDLAKWVEEIFSAVDRLHMTVSEFGLTTKLTGPSGLTVKAEVSNYFLTQIAIIYLGEQLDRLMNVYEKLPTYRPVSECQRYREEVLVLFRRLRALNPHFSFCPLAARLHRLDLTVLSCAVCRQPVKQRLVRRPRQRRPGRVLYFPPKSA